MDAMLPVIEAITPVFLIILCGCAIRRWAFLPESFLAEGNRFVFYVSLPFLIFTGILRSNLKTFTPPLVLSVVIPTLAMAAAAFLLGWLIGLRKGRLGTFVQTSFHGNVSYIGLAILVSMLGEGGLARGSVLVGALILVNNAFAIAILSYTSRHEPDAFEVLKSLMKNPVIIATFAGILVVYGEIPVPRVILKTMGILSNIALPMALIIIGASMSLTVLRRALRLAGVVSALKLFILPAMSLALCRIAGIPPLDGLPGILLLATPTAITSYTLAKEIGGEPDLASNVVTLSTVLSPVSLVFWATLTRAL